MKKTAQRVEEIERERDDAVSKISAAEEKAAEAEKRAEQTLTESPSMKLKIENAQLKSQLELIKSWLREIQNKLPAPLRVIIENILHDRNPFRGEPRQKRDRDMDVER